MDSVLKFVLFLTIDRKFILLTVLQGKQLCHRNSTIMESLQVLPVCLQLQGKMSEQFLGCTVSVKCIDDLGTYQGKIIDLNKNSLTLAKAFCNGIPYSSSFVKLR